MVSPADGLRLDLADGLDRHRPVADRLPPVEQHHRRHLASRPSWPRARRRSSASRLGRARRGGRQLRGRHRRRWCSSRSSSGAAGSGGARTTSCRGSSTSLILFAGATLIFPLHVPGGAFIHSAVGHGAARLHPGARRRGAHSSWPSRAGDRPGIRRSAIPLFTWAVVGLVVGIGASSTRRSSTRLWTRDRAALGRRWRRSSTSSAYPPTDRLMTIDAGGLQVLHRPRRRRLAGRLRSTRSAAWPTPTTSAGWSSSGAAIVEALRPVLDRRRAAGLDRAGRVHDPCARRRTGRRSPLSRLLRTRRRPLLARARPPR